MVGAAVCDRPAESIDSGQLAFVVAASTPFEGVQIDSVGDTEILERTQQLPINGFRQTDFRRNAVVKVRQYAFAVHTLRSSSQAQQNARLIVGQQFLIGRSCRMVELIHDDVVIKLR